jgi:hypothetical protein
MTTTAARAAALALLICTCAPSSANADFLVEPFFAWTRNSETSRTVPGGGVAAEWASGWLLVGGDFGYGAGFFDPAEDVLDLIASSHVLTAGGHVGIGMPPERGGRFAPYDPSLNFGGGVRMLLNDYLGVRGDIRYFRSMRDPFDEPDPIVADLDRLHFWRFSLGAVLRFGWE